MANKPKVVVDESGAFVDAAGEAMIAIATLGLSRIYAIGETGEVSSNSLAFDIDRLRTGMMKKAPVEKEIRLETGSAPLTLGVGAGVILGRAKAGKTLLANTLRQRNPDTVRVIRYREPESDSLLYESSLVRELWTALESSADVIVVDSLRTTFYTVSGGATGKGGVNMGIFTLLTAYDLLARHHGKILLFALNPMTTDEEAIAFYLEAANGSVAHTLHAVSPKLLHVSSRSFTNRDEVRQKYEPVKDTTAAMKAKGEKAPTRLDQSDDSIAALYITTSR